MSAARLGIALLAVALGTALVQGQEPGRRAGGRAVLSLSAGWRFLPGDQPAAAQPGFDDSKWQAVDLPHTWNAQDGEDGGNDYRRGAGWYRRHLSINPILVGRRFYLQFDGASLMADVYVNGKHLGAHKGGFSCFRFDATDALDPSGDNVIAVRVDNGHLGFPPTSADFTFFGGLYRGVYLVATDPVQISTMDYGSPGVFISQRTVTPDQAEFDVRTEVENHEDKAHTVMVVTRVFDAFDRKVLTLATPQPLGGHGSASVVQPMTLGHPNLWDGRALPYLYRVKIELLVDGAACDSVNQPLGLRYFRVDPNQGFILNGRPLDLHGVNRHQDRIDKGWAISADDEAEDFALVLDLGCTAIRVSHYQQADTWYQRCDRSGIVAWAEFPFVNQALPTPEFLDNAKQQLRELIRQNYNHPAIFFWGVGNETSGAAADGVIAELAKIVREEDPTRLSTYASSHDMQDSKNWHTDVVAFNRYYGWYHGDASELAENLDKTHALHPASAFGLSEFGGGASILQHEEHPSRPDTKGRYHPEEYQAILHETTWKILKDRPFVWGKFVWCMFDFASDGRGEGDHLGRNDKGLVTYDRKTRKDAFYWYKANWSAEPVVHITSRRFAIRTRPEAEVKVYSNAPTVELFVDGVSQGAVAAPDHIFRWAGVKLAPGENQVAANAKFGGSVVTDACVWTYKSP